MTIDAAVNALSLAIAAAEGFPKKDSIPARAHNPGDLELGDQGLGTINRKTIYPDDAAGWRALRHECTLILTGRSHYIHTSMAITDVAMIYTGRDQASTWATEVAHLLGLCITDTLEDLLDLTDAPTK